MAYTKVGWKNGASGGTPINAANLEHMDAQILQNTNDIATLNSNSIKWKGNVVNSINYPNNTTNEVWINHVALEQNDIVNIKGFPMYAYGYGVLITVFSGQAFGNIQLYIPHSDREAVNRPIYFRTLADGSSDAGDGTSWRVAQVTTIKAY